MKSKYPNVHVRGVCYVSSRQKWMVFIHFFNLSNFLGYFTDFEEAVYTRLAAEQCLGCVNYTDPNSASYFVQNIARGN